MVTVVTGGNEDLLMFLLRVQTKSEEARKATVSKIDDVREKSDVLPTPESRKKFFGIF